MASISGRLMFDRERTAASSPSFPGIANVPIVLQNTDTGESLAVLTDSNGNYSFINVPDGSYQIVEAYGTTPAVQAPGDFTDASSSAILRGGTVPPISYVSNPPAGSTNLDATTPNTILLNVNGADAVNQNFLNGPVKYTPIQAITDRNVAISPVNLITKADNGTFGSYPPGTPSDTGANPNPYPDIGSQFEYVQPAPMGVVPGDGQYTIQNIMSNSVPNQQNNWWRVTDHTTGNETGRMMVVNGYVPGNIFFEQQVPVKANTHYLFSSWILNLSKDATHADPQLGVQVLGSNGQVLYSATLGELIPMNPNVPEWKQIGTVINSQDNTSLTVKFISMGPAAWGNDYAIDDISLNEVDFSVSAPKKSADRQEVNVGEIVNYTVTLTSAGINPLTNVNFKDLIPQGFEFVPGSVTVNGQSNSGADPNAGFNVPDIPGESTLTVTFSAKAVSNPAVNPAVNSASISYKYSPVKGGIPADYAIKSNEVPVKVLYSDLAITKTSDPLNVIAGNTLRYSITVRNNGADTAMNPVISDNFPAEVRNAEYSTDNGTTWNSWSGNVTLPAIAPRAASEVLVRAAVDNGASGSIQNTATVTSPTFDPNTSNNSSTINTQVDSSADLSVVKTGPVSATAGDAVTYTIVTSNSGPSDAQNVIISDAVPSGLSNAQFSTDDGATWNAWNGSYNAGALSSGRSVSIQLRASVNSSVKDAFSNTASVKGDTPDPNPANNTFSVITEVVKSADVVIRKKSDKNPVMAGEVLTYTLNVFNDGPSDAENVRVTDEISPYLQNVQFSTDNGATWNPWNGSYSIGTIANGGSVPINIRGTVDPMAADGIINNTASVTSSTPDPKQMNNSSTDNVPINTSADLSLIKTVSPQLVNHGQLLTYTLNIKNAGPNIARNTVLNDVLPSALLNGQYSTDNGATWQDASDIYQLGAVAAGASVTVLLRGTVDQSAAGTITNAATVRSDTPDPDTSNNNSAANAVVGNAADLKITKTADKTSVIAGEILTYTLTVSNAGPDSAENVVLKDAFPPTFLNPEFSTDGGSTWRAFTSPQPLGVIERGATRNILMRGTVDPNINPSETASIINTAEISSSTPDTDTTNNSSSLTTPVTVSADVGVIKTAAPDPAVAGNNITFTVDVSNYGPSNAKGVSLIDAVPSSVLNPEFSDDGGSTWRQWPGYYNIGDMAKDSKKTVQIRGILNAAAAGSITNTATVSSNTPDPDKQNNTSVISVPVGATADISVSKTSSPERVTAGGVLTYTLSINNAGPSYAENVVLSDAVPAELSNTSYSLDGGLSWSPWNGSLEIGSMAPDASMNVLIRGTVNSGAGINIVNSASVSGTTIDPNPGNNKADNSVDVNRIADISIIKTADLTSVKPGGELTYTLTVSNKGPADAVNVIISDAVPLENAKYSADNGTTFNAWNGTLTLPSLAMGATYSLKIRGTVAESITGSIVNLAAVKSDFPDPDPSNNHALLIIPAVIPEKACADISIKKCACKPCAKPGETIKYKLIIHNAGPQTAAGIILTDNLPKELTDAKYSADNGKTWNPWSGSLSIGDLLRNASATIFITAKLNTTASGTIINTASVSSKSVIDSNEGNNTASVGIRVC